MLAGMGLAPMSELDWMPEREDWAQRFEETRKSEPARALATLLVLANCRMDFVKTARLDKALQRIAEHARRHLAGSRPVRLAVLGSCTLGHLVPGIRVGAFRRGVWADVYVGDYGAYRQELQDPSSGLHRFKPDVILFSFDARHLLGGESPSADEALENIEQCWRIAQRSPGCAVVQQTILPVFQPLLGNNEHAHGASALALVWRLNGLLRSNAEALNVHLLGIDHVAARDGLSSWYDEPLWHRSKQEIHPRVSHVYGDQLGRLFAAMRGRSRKCLVLDLDNTLWGGVLADDGLDGIVLGQGTALGEAFVAFQRYALGLSQRGIILAVCSKNDESVALEAFTRHPEMVLRRGDIACFVANWNDKAANLREIARRLNIGLDALVFIDDSPFERELVRRELPEVAVPQLPEDPALYAQCIAAAGYFESLGVTGDDRDRANQYRANAEREQLRESATDMASYLHSLKMELHSAPFDEIGLPRIAQLINKTNQFNLTTRRYTEAEVRALLSDSAAVHLQFRLLDRFGDNGVISVIIGRLTPEGSLLIDTWLMSCRVLGRQVECAVLNVLVRRASRLGVTHLVGIYRPTPKNEMVKEHYSALGFRLSAEQEGETRWWLDLGVYGELTPPITVVEAS